MTFLKKLNGKFKIFSFFYYWETYEKFWIISITPYGKLCIVFFMLIEGQGDTKILVEDLGNNDVSIKDTNTQEDLEIVDDIIETSQNNQETTLYKVKSLLL